MTTYYYSDVDIDLAKKTDGDITQDTNIDAVKNSLSNIIETLPGSRRMLPEFAGDIYKILFEPIDKETAYILGEKIIEAINLWDDRVEITGLNIEPKYDLNLYRCNMNFKMTGSVGNRIYTIKFILKQD